MANISGRMESHHPAELGVVKRVRMEGVRVTFFLLTAAIPPFSLLLCFHQNQMMMMMMMMKMNFSCLHPPGHFQIIIGIHNPDPDKVPLIITVMISVKWYYIKEREELKQVI